MKGLLLGCILIADVALAAVVGARDPRSVIAVEQVVDTLGLDTSRCSSLLKSYRRSPLYVYTCGRLPEGERAEAAELLHAAAVAAGLVPDDDAWREEEHAVLRRRYRLGSGSGHVIVRLDARKSAVMLVESRAFEPCLDAPSAESLGASSPRVKEKAQSVYPEAARIERSDGDVVVQVLVGPDGAVHEACVAHVTPRGLDLDLAALDAARLYRFEPARVHGEAVAVGAWIFFEFEIR